MSVKKFRFVSPGIFINEIDNSQLPGEGGGIGPVVIGRAERGPGMRPVTVNSFSEFVEMFGNPIPGGEGGDLWRGGNRTAPTYAAYAAQAWLRNASPLTFIRLLGHQHDDATDGVAGWNIAGDNGLGQGGDGADESAAFGLFVGQDLESGNEIPLALAAVIYVRDSNIGLVGGSALSGGAVDGKVGQVVKSQGSDYEFKLKIGGVNKSVNFSESSKKYIRKVLNTNPTLLDEKVSSKTESYFLGETYDSHLKALIDESGDKCAILLPLQGHDDFHKGDQQQEAQAPKSSWVLSQHQGDYDEHVVNASTGDYQSDVSKLFRFEGLDDGAWATDHLKVSISDIKAASGDFDPYGSFTVTLRRTGDSDNAPQYVERYSSCNLNPASSDYIARRIGDMVTTWSYEENRYKTTGQYPNVSRFVRVEVDQDIDAGVADPSLIPFGFQGPPSPRTVVLVTNGDGDGTDRTGNDLGGTDTGSEDTVCVSDDSEAWYNSASDGNIAGQADTTYTLVFPSAATRSTSEEGRLSQGSMAHFGATSCEPDSTRKDNSYSECLKPWSAGNDNHDVQRTEGGEALSVHALRSAGCYDAADDMLAFEGADDAAAIRAAAGDADGLGIVPNFTLDDLVMTNVVIGADTTKSSQHVEWKPGSRRAGASVTVCGNDADAYVGIVDDGDAKTGDYKDILEHGYDSFTLPLVGGTDGVDVTQKEPFSNRVLDIGGTPQTNYAYNTVKRAIDSIADPEVVECNLAAMPGITNEGLTNHLLTTCEARADTLAIMDLEGDYVPSTENTSAESIRLPSVDQTVLNLKDRRINSSYGCCYFPWVQVRDTINDAILWAPPSVVALGTMASSQRKTEVWFAPAGFNRGGLTEGSAGLPVSQVRYRLTSRERDKLYEANINPIATFPSEGIVIFGQKTLQVTPSALDRINVRRLMIYLKKEVSRIAATILFDQNTNVTWQRFTSQVEPFLASVKSRFGLSEFKVILDETTTTPDLIDRNILYAKIMLKPARAIEFIALDFVITRSGASFED